MKRLITREVEICDGCPSEHPVTKCDECGKTFCYTCQKSQLHEHSTLLWALQHVRFCHECEARLTEARDPLMLALGELEKLRRDAQAQADLVDAKRKTLEDQISNLVEVRRRAA